MMNRYYFNDQAFTDAMERICDEEEVYYYNPDDVTEIEIEGAGSISDLQYFPNLENLYLSCAELDNVDMLLMLPRLTELIVDFSIIRDTSAIGRLANLTSLSICNQTFDTMSVTKLSKLNELCFISMSLPDPSCISALAGLEKLTIQKCELYDIAFAASLHKLQYLDICLNHIKDISPLQELHALEVINLWGNKVADLSPLKDLSGITKINISENPIDWNLCSPSELDRMSTICQLF